MKKIVILTTSLLLVSGGINATETLNKLVDKKIEQTTATMEASLPSVPGSALKAIWKIIKTASKLIDELPYNVIAKNIGVSINDAMEMSVDETVGKALLKDLSDLNIKVADNFDIGIMGLRARKLLIAMDENAIKTKKNIKSLQSLTRSDVEFIKAKNILKENPDITLDELALKVRKEIIEETNSKNNNKVAKNSCVLPSKLEKKNLSKETAWYEMERKYNRYMLELKYYILSDRDRILGIIKEFQSILDNHTNKEISENYIFFTTEYRWVEKDEEIVEGSYELLKKFFTMDFLSMSKKELSDVGFLISEGEEGKTIINLLDKSLLDINITINKKTKEISFSHISPELFAY